MSYATPDKAVFVDKGMAGSSLLSVRYRTGLKTLAAKLAECQEILAIQQTAKMIHAA